MPSLDVVIVAVAVVGALMHCCLQFDHLLMQTTASHLCHCNSSDAVVAAAADDDIVVAVDHHHYCHHNLIDMDDHRHL